MKCIPRALLLSLSLCFAAEAADPLILAQSLPGRLPGTLPGQQPPATPQPAPSPPPASEPGKPARLPGQGLPGQSAPAQPASGGSSLATQGATTQAVNPDVIALRTTSDLVIRDLAFNGNGEVTFNLVNRGEVGINVQSASVADAKKMTRVAATSGPPIVIDVYIGTAKVTLPPLPRLGGKETKSFTVQVPNANDIPKCLQPRDVKVHVDPQNQIPELHEDNNVTAANVARPCPDLAIKSIKRDYEGLLNETYRVKVTVINQGNAPSPRNQVWATSLPGGVWPVTGWPTLVPVDTLKALAPGETTSFKVGGSVVSANKTSVRIMLDRDQKVAETDESNNNKDDRL